MPCSYSLTAPAQGDSVVVLLRKWLQAVGATPGCPDEREYNLVWELVEFYGGTPRPGDSLPDLWRKVLRALDDNTCHCGDWQHNTIQRILEILSPGTFRPGDSIYQLLWRILEAVNTVVVTCCPPPTGDWEFVTDPVTAVCDFGLVTAVVDCSDDWGVVV